MQNNTVREMKGLILSGFDHTNPNLEKELCTFLTLKILEQPMCLPPCKTKLIIWAFKKILTSKEQYLTVELYHFNHFLLAFKYQLSFSSS